jgi:hypothetical protein
MQHSSVECSAAQCDECSLQGCSVVELRGFNEGERSNLSISPRPRPTACTKCTMYKLSGVGVDYIYMYHVYIVS